ncbi:MAG: Maf family protein, partial [Muribaculaceae bacterium]|nr:Maf family protein [Muribaculaceae bacterium]
MISSILPPKIFDFRVVLASQSPRRRELLQMLVPDLAIATVKDVEETYPASLPAEQVPEYLSQLKAKAYKGDLVEGELLLTADTVVVLDGEILGKPIDEADAEAILRK